MSRPIIASLLALVGAVMPSVVRAQTALHEVKWRYDYQAARKESQERGLPLIVDIGTQSCFWCRRLDETTFRDARVINVMNEKFVPLKVDAERHGALAQALRVTSYPTLVLAGPDGTIINVLEGYQEAASLHDSLQRVVANLATPEGMQRDLQQATKWIAAGEFARAIAVLKKIVEDGRGRGIQQEAHKMLGDIDQQAQQRLGRARLLHTQGQVGDAIKALGEIARDFAGLESAREASDWLARIAQAPEVQSQQRSRRAQELLAQAKEFHKSREYVCFIDRCEMLVSGFGDLPEGQEAAQLYADLKAHPEVFEAAAEQLTDRLANLLLALADSHMRRGQRQQAIGALERVLRSYAGTRQAESAQLRLNQLAGGR